VKAPSALQRGVLVVVATALLALSGTMAWATVNDFTERALVANGVSIAGVDLSGMTESQARDIIEETVSTPLLSGVAVNAGGERLTFDPRGAVSVDVEGMLAEAYAPRRSASYLERLDHDLTGQPLDCEIEPLFSVDEAVLGSWLDHVIARVDCEPVNAKVRVVGNKVKIDAEQPGAKTDRLGAESRLRAAFSGREAIADSKAVVLPVHTLQPKVTEVDLGKTLVVDLSQRRIRLFDGAKLEKTYRCAIGTPYHPTPQGHFKIVLKRYRPTWVNPAKNGWGANMPARIAPGPGNPLGTRAMNLSAPGIRFHGTNNIGSVGTAASHGCMRMRMPDIEDFYERVKVGTQVYIVP